METPCPRCGTLKTESVRHGFIYNMCWKMGYHLRRCSFCNRKRFLKRGDKNRPHPNDLTAEELTDHFNRRIAAAIRKDAAASGVVVKSMASHAAPLASGLGSRPGFSSVGVADPEVTSDYGLCPKCGNARYRRSRRRWYERLMKRPRMARCLKCEHRFPYPH
jgi:hypothetical protein